MKLRGKRWIYQLEGRRLEVENAWSWTMWAQERVVFDGRCLRKAGGYLTSDRSFSLSPDETGLSQPLHVVLFAGFFRIHCLVTYGSTNLEPRKIERGEWRARRGAWPGETHAA